MNRLDLERMRVLVVDDAESVRMLLVLMLRSLGYEVREACNGNEAYQLIVAEGIQIVVCDWQMPEMDGLTLCRKLRETQVDHYVYFILVSVSDTQAHFLEGMDAGADDFLFKPVNIDQLRVRLRAGRRVLELENRLAERNGKLTEAYGQIKSDLDAAAQFQRSLLPAKSLRFGQAECEWFCLPSLFVSGDELNAFHLDADHVGFYNLDVSGHGVPAAMMSATLSRMFSTNGNGGLLTQTRGDPPREFILSPASVASALNRQFQTTADNSMYFTLVYGVLNLHTGDVRLSQAGHTFPILITSQHDAQMLGEPSSPIGFIPHADYKDCEITLSKGDRLFMYSDGITECEDSQGQVFGEDRLRALLDAQRGVSLESALQTLEAALYDWRGRDVAGFRDDVSMLAIEYR